MTVTVILMTSHKRLETSKMMSGIRHATVVGKLKVYNQNGKGKDIPVTGHGGP
jgi:hypothetical protein